MLTRKAIGASTSFGQAERGRRRQPPTGAWYDENFNDFDGIFAHTNFQADRSDGGAIGLYAWLRLYCGKTAGDAYPLFRTLLSDKTLAHRIEVAPDKKAWAINVSSVVLITVHI